MAFFLILKKMKIENSYLFEVAIATTPAAGNKYNFPNNLGELNNVLVTGIEVYSADQLTNSPLSGANVASANGQKSACLVVVDGVTEKIRQIPLVNLIPQLNGGLQREIEPFTANISKSYILLVSATNLSINQVFIVNWLYKRKP